VYGAEGGSYGRAAAWRSSLHGSQRSSWSRNAITSAPVSAARHARAGGAPALRQAEQGDPARVRARQRLDALRARSGEASSTTVRCQCGQVWATTLSTASAIQRSPVRRQDHVEAQAHAGGW
jgi:hypothetical protein